jgi:coenzyme F420-reducing hydrogenase gamma subunit
MPQKMRLAVWKLASCDGCQLSLLDLEDELLRIADAYEIAYFVEASSAAMRPEGSFDLSFVDGSITTPHQAEIVREARRMSRILVPIGACATAGGIQGLRNFREFGPFSAAVYPHPELLDALDTSTPVSAHVPIDFELRGCPINKRQALEVLAALIAGRAPNVGSHSVCIECKLRGTPCVMVARGISCMGPVTHAGCGALCPAYGRGCYGCYGPMETPNTFSWSGWWQQRGMEESDLRDVFRTFNAWSEAFREESKRHGS